MGTGRGVAVGRGFGEAVGAGVGDSSGKVGSDSSSGVGPAFGRGPVSGAGMRGTIRRYWRSRSTRTAIVVSRRNTKVRRVRSFSRGAIAQLSQTGWFGTPSLMTPVRRDGASKSRKMRGVCLSEPRVKTGTAPAYGIRSACSFAS